MNAQVLGAEPLCYDILKYGCAARGAATCLDELFGPKYGFPAAMVAVLLPSNEQLNVADVIQHVKHAAAA